MFGGVWWWCCSFLVAMCVDLPFVVLSCCGRFKTVFGGVCGGGVLRVLCVCVV